MSPAQRVAVLGAGIMGSSAALFLARGGCAVTVFDRADAAMSGASRWNEGKIHLGFLYAADPSLRTAAEVLPGGLSFKPLVEELIGTSLAPAVTPDDDIYLTHPDSVVSAEAMRKYFHRVAKLIADHDSASYLGPLGAVRELSRRELEGLSAAPLAAGFQVPERSLNTLWVADRVVEALLSEPAVEMRLNHCIEAVEPRDGSWNGPWRIRCSSGTSGDYDIVINALWEGRLAIDVSLGLRPLPRWSHRYRLSLFVTTDRVLRQPSVVLSSGPFGDVKNYDGRNFYLSWYPAGLVAEGEEVIPPAVRLPPPEAFTRAVRRGLTALLPPLQQVFAHAANMKVGGGWVFAQGRGSLADASASLHRRDRFGAQRKGSYFSVDTGKYSSAPWLARMIANQILAP